MRRLPTSLIALAMILVACSSSDVTSNDASSTTAPPKFPGADIVLESVTFGGDVITFKPVDWDFDEEAGTAVPPGSKDSRHSWTIIDVCLGDCVPRSNSEWEAEVTSIYADVTTSETVDVVREITSDDSYLLELHWTDGYGELAYSRWVDGAPQTIMCTATGPLDVIDQLFAALEFACENTRAALDSD